MAKIKVTRKTKPAKIAEEKYNKRATKQEMRAGLKNSSKKKSK